MRCRVYLKYYIKKSMFKCHCKDLFAVILIESQIIQNKYSNNTIILVRFYLKSRAQWQRSSWVEVKPPPGLCHHN